MTLEQFAQRWVDSGKPHRPPQNSRVIETDYTLSMIVYRQEGFQVELYLAKPNWSTPKHTHSFDSVTVFNGGKMLGRRGVALDENPPWVALEDCDIDLVQPTLPLGHWHQIRATDRGFSFYNVQYWPEEKPTSATIGYYGDAMGPVHQGVINNASE
jgi:hypothetical protein